MGDDMKPWTPPTKAQLDSMVANEGYQTAMDAMIALWVEAGALPANTIVVRNGKCQMEIDAGIPVTEHNQQVAVVRDSVDAKP